VDEDVATEVVVAAEVVEVLVVDVVVDVVVVVGQVSPGTEQDRDLSGCSNMVPPPHSQQAVFAA